MKKIKNIKTNENKKNLLKESGFKNIQEAKKGLNMKNEKAQLVYQALLETYNQQYDEMKKNQKKTKSKEKSKELQNIRKGSISITQPTLHELKAFLLPYKKQGNVVITVVNNGKVVTSYDDDKTTTHAILDINLNQSNHNVHTALLNGLYYGAKEFLGGKRENVVGFNGFDEWNSRKAIISFDVNVKPQKVAQAFKQGITNCLFTPIIDWAIKKQENAKTAKTAANYACRIDNLKRLEERYRESGVNENELQDIANKIQMDLIIDQPFQKEFLVKKCDKKPLTKFRFINTKIDHIDLNEVVSKEPEYVSYEELNDIYNTLINKKEYFTYTRCSSEITSISTLRTTFKVKQDFQDFINTFEKENGIDGCYLDDFKEVELSKFVRQGNHLNSTIDFIDVNELDVNDDEDDEDISEEQLNIIKSKYPDEISSYEYWCSLYHHERREQEEPKYNHIDQKQAYRNYKKCKYYEGFLGKITDFRKTDKFVTDSNGYTLPGLYRVKNIQLNGKLQKLNTKMKIYNDFNIYPTPELKFILDNGGTFEIIEGCWGNSISFDMDDETWLQKDNGIKYYCKYVGSIMSYNDKKSFYVKGTKKYIKNILSVIDYDSYKYFGGEELQVNYNKPYNQHLSHIASFITSYTRLNTLEQLMSIPYENLIRVCVDGIYLYGDFELKNNFIAKPERIKSNVAGESFISNYDVEYCEPCKAEFRDHFQKELHLGCGGSGKTHNNLTDKGLIKTCYVAPSWKLARNKQKELGVDCSVHHRMLTGDPAIWGRIAKNYNVIIIDEISLISDTNKAELFKRFNNNKLIFCGDPGYQLDGFSIDEKVKFIPFSVTGFENTIYHKNNYRVSCDILGKHLQNIRDLITLKKHKCVKQYVIDHFQTIDEITDYKVEDMILARTHLIKDSYTEKYAHLEKYYVQNTDRNFCKGEIVIGERPANGVLRHCYTVHSTIGETAENNLYIDINGMSDALVLYTAISRPRRFSQIFLVKNTKNFVDKNAYSKGKIYIIKCKDKVYIGSTVKTLEERFNEHKSSSNRCTSKVLFEMGSPTIELLEECPCENESQLIKREGELMLEYPNRVNKFVTGRNQ